MKRRNINPDPPEHRPDPPPGPPLTPILAGVIEDLRQLDRMREAEIDGEILKAFLRSYARLKGLSEKEVMDKIRSLKL